MADGPAVKTVRVAANANNDDDNIADRAMVQRLTFRCGGGDAVANLVRAGMRIRTAAMHGVYTYITLSSGRPSSFIARDFGRPRRRDQYQRRHSPLSHRAIIDHFRFPMG